MPLASKARNALRSGRTSANQGRRKRSYWGEYTLLVKKKRASIANPIVHGSVDGSRPLRRRQTMITPTMNNAADKRLMIRVDPHGVCPTITWQPTDHTLSTSTG